MHEGCRFGESCSRGDSNAGKRKRGRKENRTLGNDGPQAAGDSIRPHGVPQGKYQINSPRTGGSHLPPGDCLFVEIGICKGKSGHRTTLSFRTSSLSWCGNLHRISDNPASYRLSYPTIFRNFSTRNCTPIQEIATEAGALVRNDREFDNSNLSVCRGKMEL